MGSNGLPVTLLCTLIYVMLYCSNLCKAKKVCLQLEGVGNPSSAAIKKAITREELSHHCHKRTHGEVETCQLMEQLILNMAGRTDSRGTSSYSMIGLQQYGKKKRSILLASRIRRESRCTPSQGTSSKVG